MTNEEDLGKIRMLLLEAIIDKGKAILDDISDSAHRSIYMLNFSDEKIKDAIRIIDSIIQSLQGSVNK